MAVGSRQAVRSALHSSKRVRYLMNLKQKKKKSQPSTQTQPHKHKHWNHQTNEWWDNILYNHQKTGDIHLTVRFTDLAHLRLLREEWQKTRPHLHLATPTLLLSRWATVWVYFLCSEKAVKKLKIHTHTESVEDVEFLSLSTHNQQTSPQTRIPSTWSNAKRLVSRELVKCFI